MGTPSTRQSLATGVTGGNWAWRGAFLLAALPLLWLMFSLVLAGQVAMGLGALVLGGAALWVYSSARSVAWRYLFPGVVAMLVFVALPLFYTVQLGFSNYSSAHLLSQDRARDYLLGQTLGDEANTFVVSVLALPGGQHRLLLAGQSGEPARWQTAALNLPHPGGVPVVVQAAAPFARTQPGTEVDLRTLVALRARLQGLQLQVPQGPLLSYSGLREFAPLLPVWVAQADGALLQRATGARYAPNAKTGYFEHRVGEVANTVSPGFKVGVGLANYQRLFFDEAVRGPFLAIFVWTVVFALLTVVFAAGLGLVLAVVLNWQALPERALYRTLLFLPYAVPGFISILVFKGLFNQSFGEINAVLHALFGVRPAWFADPWLAKAMLLMVNTWLGFPYFMILCSGLIKTIPADLYEASAIAGAGPLTSFFKITAPLIVKPLTPLLISAFAFNFNNFVLVALLTDGRPDFLNTALPAGTTDILVSYTYRMAFTDAGQNFGLAAAISTVIFLLVALMAGLQLRATQGASAASSSSRVKGA